MEKQKEFIIRHIAEMTEEDAVFLKKIYTIIYKYLLRKGGR